MSGQKAGWLGEAGEETELLAPSKWWEGGSYCCTSQSRGREGLSLYRGCCWQEKRSGGANSS